MVVLEQSHRTIGVLAGFTELFMASQRSLLTIRVCYWKVIGNTLFMWFVQFLASLQVCHKL